MASDELIKIVNEYDKWITSHKPDEQALNAYTEACRAAFLIEHDDIYGRKITKKGKKYILDAIKTNTGANLREFEDWAWKTYKSDERELILPQLKQYYDMLKLEAPYLFESYMLYMEKNIPYEKRFYDPRKSTLKVVAKDFQDLEDDILDVYGLSMPSRVGKSTIAIFFLTWVGLRKPMSHNAMGGHSGILVKRFFTGLKNIITTTDYNYEELFKELNPEMQKVVESKTSDPSDYRINLGKEDEFPTYVCRGIDGTWTGAIDVSEDGYLYVDDLVRDREHSLSAVRMENTYQEYQNKMLDRMNDGAKKILVGTLWSVYDPLLREEKENLGNPRARFRKIPALNDKEESNFQYDVKGFSTSYYINMRDRLDKAEWMAKFQQAPFVREGLTFPVEELRRFDGDTPKKPYRMIAVIDPAFGGGDNLSMPICKDYGEKERYIVDWVHDKRTIANTIPLVVDKIEMHNITQIRVEKNRGGDLFADKLKEEMENRGIHSCSIELENASNLMSKEDKISGYSDFIKRDFIFLSVKNWTEEDMAEYHASEQYRKAIDELTLFSAEGKNINDDAADAITQLAIFLEQKIRRTTRIIRSPV